MLIFWWEKTKCQIYKNYKASNHKWMFWEDTALDSLVCFINETEKEEENRRTLSSAFLLSLCDRSFIWIFLSKLILTVRLFKLFFSLLGWQMGKEMPENFFICSPDYQCFDQSRAGRITLKTFSSRGSSCWRNWFWKSWNSSIWIYVPGDGLFSFLCCLISFAMFSHLL